MIEFYVPGLPRPQGSKSQWNDPVTGKAMMKEAAKGLKPWRRSVSMIAQTKCHAPLQGAVKLSMVFVFERPKTSKNVLPIVKPDYDKLARAATDALTKIAYRDDAQVTRADIAKRYGEKHQLGVHITIEEDVP